MKHNKITSRKSHYGEQTIKNLIKASNCLAGIHSVTWGLRANKKGQIAGPEQLFK
jgi:hypothetical protein